MSGTARIFHRTAALGHARPARAASDPPRHNDDPQQVVVKSATSFGKDLPQFALCHQAAAEARNDPI